MVRGSTAPLMYFKYFCVPLAAVVHGQVRSVFI